MSELRSAYEEAEARAVESAKAAWKEVRRKSEAYENLLAAARAVVEGSGAGITNNVNAGTVEHGIFVPFNLFDALRAAVEATGE